MTEEQSTLEAVTAQRRVEHYRWMLLARRLDERLSVIYRQGRVPGGVYLGFGQEAISAAIGMTLRRGDIFSPLIRDTAGRLAFGESLDNVFRVYLGKRSGTMRGRDGNVHRGILELGILPMVSHLGAMLAPVAGLMFARRQRGEERGTDDAVGLAVIGDGGSNAGATNEAFSVAALEKLPVVYVLVNNRYAYSTANHQTFACADLCDRGRAFGLTPHRCDGTDGVASLTCLAEAVHAARNGGGPQLVIADAYRLKGHAEHDDASYVPQTFREGQIDCLELAETTLAEAAIMDAEQRAAIEQEVLDVIEAAWQAVQDEPEPTAAEDDWQIYAAPEQFSDVELR